MLHTKSTEWDSSSQRSLSDSVVNERLSTIESGISTVLNTNPHAQYLIAELGRIINSSASQNRYTIKFIEFCKKFRDDVKKNVSVQYAVSLGSTIKHLDKYIAKYGELDFSSIDIDFYRKFKGMLKDENLAKNTVAKQILNLKRFLNEATELGLNTSMKFKSKNFKAEKEQVYNIYLTNEELFQIHKHKFSKPYLQRAADIFLIGAFTGMRFSDYSRLSPANFDLKRGVITQDMKKVSGRVMIPIHWVVREILEKYNYELPEPISNQKMNEFLKEVGKEAGINSQVIKTRTEGHKKVTKAYMKYDLITTHTARRSLCTNMYLAGVPILTIMKLSGHKTIQQFLNYIKVTEIETSNALIGHEFFNK